MSVEPLGEKQRKPRNELIGTGLVRIVLYIACRIIPERGVEGKQRGAEGEVERWSGPV